jgi:hypothetical protein
MIGAFKLESPVRGGDMTRPARRIGLMIAVIALGGLVSPAARADDDLKPAAVPAYLYKTTFVRAAPGKLLELIALCKNLDDALVAAGDERPLGWRHAEGDQWDLMLIFPMKSWEEYYSGERTDRRGAAAALEAGLAPCIAWREDLFVLGPPIETLRTAFEASGFFHIEMFVALPGKQADLLREREMENAYQVAMGRPAYFNFVRVSGAAWDVFSLGCYRDMLHWADTAGIPKEKKDEAARAAGFKDSASVGPCMRTLIDFHRDTMGGAIK